MKKQKRAINDKKKIYCCNCEKSVEARLTSGSEVYPHRHDLFNLPFWKCDTCKKHVGCHHKTANKYRPLGVIPSPEISAARQHIHKLIDPWWRAEKISRSEIYALISIELGYKYHTANIKTIEEARKVYAVARKVLKNLFDNEGSVE